MTEPNQEQTEPFDGQEPSQSADSMTDKEWEILNRDTGRLEPVEQ